MQNLVQKVIDFSKKQKQSKLFLDFVSDLYSQNQICDFENYEIEELYNLAISSFDFFKNKKNGLYKVNVTGCKEEKDDYNAIIEIANDDKPFLVDSIVSIVEKQGFVIKNIIHPIYGVKRKENGDLSQIVKAESASCKESLIQVHLKNFMSAKECKDLKKKIETLLDNVAIIVEDWQKITSELEKTKEFVSLTKVDQKKVPQILEFIDWLIDRGFLFLGFKEFSYEKKGSKYSLKPNFQSVSS